MKIVLAYSGGLDTSVALKWLGEKYDAQIIAFCADIGQLEDLNEIKQKAYDAGAVKVYVEDMREVFLKEFALRALKAHAAYEGKYLLAAPLSRPLIAHKLVEIAHKENANAVAHGATGKGNDQVRFYTSIVALDPEMQILAPVMEWDLKSRDEEIAYAHKHQIPITVSNEKPYSIDTNIWGTSIECGPLDDLTIPPPKEVYQVTLSPLDAPDHAVKILIGFKQGIPVSLDNQPMEAVELVLKLNALGASSGVGRIDIVENRVAGIKTRGVYESPAATILHAAHAELENLVLDRDLIHHKAQVAQTYAKLTYYGLWFSPLREALDAFIDYTQKRVSGFVAVTLYKGNIIVNSRSSKYALYDYALSTYDTQDKFDHSAGKGFSYLWSMPLRVKSIVDHASRY